VKTLGVKFADIVGQERLKHWFINVLKSQSLGHAYAFCAEEGMGKSFLSHVFSKMLLCEACQNLEMYDRDDSKETLFMEVCDVCQHCKTFDGEAHPDFYRLKREKASIGVDDVRRLKEHIHIKPMYAKHKIFLIPESELMTPQAQNALLKTIEDPPPHVLFFLLTTQFQTYLPTIQSRVVKLDLEKYSPNEISAFLKSRDGKLLQMEWITKISDGNLGMALKMVEDAHFLEMREAVFAHVVALFEKKEGEDMALFSYLDKNKEWIGTILNMFALFFRDLLALQYDNWENILINVDKKDIMISRKKMVSPNQLLHWLDQTEKVKLGLSMNVGFGLSVEYWIISLFR
jgi:DNA polymerase III subunit delta'